jgi:peptidoglycan L-alanyl-D-glutamate endopeptidase CwlK
MAYVLGKKSLSELKGVHEDLVRVVKRAIEITPQDFSVHDGIRSLDEQRELVRTGASKTLQSRHITGHAVDLVPYLNGKLRWEWEPIYQIADAVRTAAREFGVPIRWGAAWDVRLTDQDDAPEDIVADYSARRRKQGKKAFLDGPHYELPIDIYPPQG